MTLLTSTEIPNASAKTMDRSTQVTTFRFGPKSKRSSCSLFSRVGQHRIATSSVFTAPAAPRSSTRTVTEAFQHNYNYFRPHGSLRHGASGVQRTHKSLTGSTPSKGLKAVAFKEKIPNFVSLQLGVIQPNLFYKVKNHDVLCFL
jgi:hypothetical protein